MAAVDHEARLQARCAQPPFGFRRVARFVVAALAPATQHNVRVRVARGGDDRRATVLINAEKTVRRARRQQGVERRLDTAVRAVLEADRHRQAAGHFAVRLGLGGARPDRRPTHHVRQVLRHDGIEKFGGRGQAEGRDLEENLACQAQPGGQIAGIIHAGIVDQPLPADRGARFFEIDAHENADRIGKLLPQRRQPPRVVDRTGRIMDRARTDDGQQTRVAPVQDGLGFGAAAGRRRERDLLGRERFFDDLRGHEAFEAADARVFERAAGLAGRHGAVQGEPDIKPQKPPRRNSCLMQRLCARLSRS